MAAAGFPPKEAAGWRAILYSSNGRIDAHLARRHRTLPPEPMRRRIIRYAAKDGTSPGSTRRSAISDVGALGEPPEISFSAGHSRLQAQPAAGPIARPGQILTEALSNRRREADGQITRIADATQAEAVASKAMVSDVHCSSDPAFWAPGRSSRALNAQRPNTSKHLKEALIHARSDLRALGVPISTAQNAGAEGNIPTWSANSPMAESCVPNRAVAEERGDALANKTGNSAIGASI